MNYTNFTLFVLGLLGILLHNLVELNKLNRTGGNARLNLKKYLKLEVYSLLISIIMVFIAVLIKQEIKQLESAQKWLGGAFVTIGYTGQSLLIFVMGKANKTIGNDQP